MDDYTIFSSQSNITYPHQAEKIFILGLGANIIDLILFGVFVSTFGQAIVLQRYALGHIPTADWTVASKFKNMEVNSHVILWQIHFMVEAANFL